jgi:hypothetical protein
VRCNTIRPAVLAMAVRAVTKKQTSSIASQGVSQIPLNKALPPCVSNLTPSRRKAFVPKFLSFLSHFVCGWRCYFAPGAFARALISTERKENNEF